MTVGRSALLIVLMQVVGVCGASAIDLTSTWRVEEGPASVQFVDIVQTGATVAMTLQTGLGPLPLSGTFDEPTLSLTVQFGTCPSCFTLSARVLPDGNWFDGLLLAPPSPTGSRVLASRCECVDGNGADGDGCDAQCRVEPCFNCAGTPSVCTPTADGGACDDGMDCTAGETCSAGVCSGAPVAACRDMSGLWNVTNTETGGAVIDSVSRIEQRDGVVLIRDAASGVAGGLGVIDTATGAFALSNPNSFLLCGSDVLNGVLSGDELSFDATGTRGQALLFSCALIDFTSVGTRVTCGDGELDAGEQCDDGNAASGDGCDANCHTTGCGSGIVTAGEQCDDGNTAAGDGCGPTCAIEPCWTCAGQSSICAPSVQPLCAIPRHPHRARLALRQSSDDTNDAIAVRSSNTETVAEASLGDPRAATDYQVCLFDTSTATPSLLFGARIPAGGTCGTQPCWRSVAGGFAYQNRDAAPHGIAKLLVVGDRGGDGRALAIGESTGLSAGPSGFPALPLPVPLELQIQSTADPAGCFAIEIPAAGVTRNDAAHGRFKARGAP